MADKSNVNAEMDGMPDSETSDSDTADEKHREPAECLKDIKMVTAKLKRWTTANIPAAGEGSRNKRHKDHRKRGTSLRNWLEGLERELRWHQTHDPVYPHQGPSGPSASSNEPKAKAKSKARAKSIATRAATWGAIEKDMEHWLKEAEEKLEEG